MVRIILSGCNGKMGKVITGLVKERNDCKIVAGVDIFAKDSEEFPVFESIDKITFDSDVIIDFSNPASLDSNLSYSISNNIPIVICTTGFSKSQVNKIMLASKKAPIFYSGNMSLGINLLIELSKKAATILGNNFDIEIIEKHHNQKIDSPSGTALMIADEISESQNLDFNYMYDRHSFRKPRSKNEIGIHSIRGGNIVGDHEVIFAGHDETITISHSAKSKDIFAVGSINAAVFMVNKKPGIYNMSNLLANK